MELAPLLGGLAPGVVDLRNAARPACATGGRCDVSAVLAACETVAASGCDEITLNLSGKNHDAEWGDAETALLCTKLRSTSGARVAGRLQQLWLHHTPIGDASCASIATLLGEPCPKLEQLHLSDSRVTAAGLAPIFKAAALAGYGQSAGARASRRKKLYINVRHLGDAAAIAAAASCSDHCLVRVLDTSRVGDRIGTLSHGGGGSHGRGSGGRGIGDGSPYGKGAKGASKGMGNGMSGRGRGYGTGAKGAGAGRGASSSTSTGTVLYTHTQGTQSPSTPRGGGKGARGYGGAKGRGGSGGRGKGKGT